MLLDDVRLERARVPAAEWERVKRTVRQAADGAHERADGIERQRQSDVGQACATEPFDDHGDSLEGDRAAREMVRASDGDNSRHRALELRRRGVTDESTERVPDQEGRTLARVQQDLLQGDRDVLGDVVVDAARGSCAELTRAAVTAQIEVENVVARARQGVRETAGGKVPRVAILAEPVDEEHRRTRRSAVVREALAHHRKRYPPAGDNELLHERSTVLAIDRLLDGSAVKDHVFSPTWP